MSSSPIACLFPGQGSQTGELRGRAERILPELVEHCLELVGEDPFPRIAESTRFAQPAIFCASLAGWSELRESVQPLALAGHSLGELSALVAAEALDPHLGLELAVRRGELMARVAAPDGGMLAVLGAPDTFVSELARDHDLVVANDNAPGQVVLAGPLPRLREAALHAREQQARAIMLDVAGAFHSPAMADAVPLFRAELEQVELRAPAIPVICGWRALPFDDVRAELAAAIVEPVRWRASMSKLAEIGARAFLDVGPGEVLARLVPRNLPDASVILAAELQRADTLEARPGVR